MPITIKRAETVRLARTLKQRTGLSMARIIHDALEARMRRLGNTAIDEERKLEVMRAISRRVARMSDNDPRSAGEIIGYDEYGLPA
jgi:hypothetical protein